ncbi:hypothetical protein Hanom_Chr04g00368811 [Helianthus anomalus]
MTIQPHLRVPVTPDKLNMEICALKGLKFYHGTTRIEKELVKNFRDEPVYPVIASCYMFDLTSEKASKATPQKPYVRVFPLKQKTEKRQSYVVLITGIHITSDK